MYCTFRARTWNSCPHARGLDPWAKNKSGVKWGGRGALIWAFGPEVYIHEIMLMTAARVSTRMVLA